MWVEAVLFRVWCMKCVRFLFFFFKQKTAYEISACLVGSEMCIETGLPGYLILFDTHTFEPQCQLQFSELPP